MKSYREVVANFLRACRVDRKKKRGGKKIKFFNPEKSWDRLHVNRISLFEINLLVTDMRHDLEYRIPGFCLNESHPGK